MPDLLKTKIPKARKIHWCDGCGGYTIPKGTVYRRDTYAFDGRVYDWKLCDPCVDITGLVFDDAIDPWDGITGEDYFAWAEDAQWSSDINVMRKAKAYLIRSGNEHMMRDED